MVSLHSPKDTIKFLKQTDVCNGFSMDKILIIIINSNYDGEWVVIKQRNAIKCGIWDTKESRRK